MALLAGVSATGCSDHQKAAQNQTDHKTPLTINEMEHTEPLNNALPPAPETGPMSSMPLPTKPITMPDDGTKNLTKKLPPDRVIDREAPQSIRQGYGKTTKDSQIMADAMATGMTTPMTAHIKDGDRPSEPMIDNNYDTRYHKALKELSPSNVLEPENKEKKEAEEKEKEKDQREKQEASMKENAIIANHIAYGSREK